MRIFGIMMGNALAYNAGLILTLMGVSGGISLMVATTNFALIYLISRYAHEVQKLYFREHPVVGRNKFFLSFFII